MASFNDSELNQIIAAFQHWAKSREDIFGLALVGSYARGNPNDNSDLDLLVLTNQPDMYKSNKDWLNAIDWNAINSTIQQWHDQEYGLVWSCHVILNGGREVEVGFGDNRWLDTALTDEGTLKVIKNGFKIIFDPENLLENLIENLKLEKSG